VYVCANERMDACVFLFVYLNVCVYVSVCMYVSVCL